MTRTYTECVAENTRRAERLISALDLQGLWCRIGAEIHQVGSMRMGLLAKHRDLDFHIYSDAIDIRSDFEVMGRLAALPGILRIEYGNLLNTDEACVEWHAWYRDAEDDDSEAWQIDMIHIRRGSRYDGYFEKVADHIAAALNDEQREAILQLKFETPNELKIMGIEYYQAVIRDGVRTWDEFAAWRQAHPVEGVVEWMP